MKKIFAVVGIMTMLVGFVGCDATEQNYEAEPECAFSEETDYEPYKELVNTNKSIIVSEGDSFAEIDIYASNEDYLYWYNGQFYQTEEEARAAIKFN